jgi:hypothetical protein
VACSGVCTPKRHNRIQLSFRTTTAGAVLIDLDLVRY